MKIKTHITVQLRDGQFAEISERRLGPAPFTIFGTLRDGTPHLWRDNGRWREDGKRHALDLLRITGPKGETIHQFKA